MGFGYRSAVSGRIVMADGGYQGNREVIMPYRKRSDGSELPGWKIEINTVHKQSVPAWNMPCEHEVPEHPA